MSILSECNIRTVHQKSKTNPHQTQKDDHQDNLSFTCLHFYKHNRQNIPCR